MATRASVSNVNSTLYWTFALLTSSPGVFTSSVHLTEQKTVIVSFVQMLEIQLFNWGLLGVDIPINLEGARLEVAMV